MPPRILEIRTSSNIRCLHHRAPFPLPLGAPHSTNPTPRRTFAHPLALHAQPQSSTYATITGAPAPAPAPARPIYRHKIAKTLAKAVPAVTNRSEQSHPPTLPPAYKAPTSEKTLLTRLYLSLLRSSPLTVIFQHNAVKATEWTAIRRELALALAKVDAGLPEGEQKLARFIRITTVNTALFGVSMRIADKPAPGGKLWNHGTSPEAAMAGQELKRTHHLAPLLVGPLATLTFPVLSPKHIDCAMELLFPAKRTAAKKGFDPAATAGMQKYILLGARVQEKPVGRGRALDGDGIRWLSGLKTVEEMRGEIVAILQSVGGGEVVRALESVAIMLGRTVEGRRRMLEEEAGGPKEEVKGEN